MTSGTAVATRVRTGAQLGVGLLGLVRRRRA